MKRVDKVMEKLYYVKFFIHLPIVAGVIFGPKEGG
jgi:hypothetical protein